MRYLIAPKPTSLGFACTCPGSAGTFRTGDACTGPDRAGSTLVACAGLGSVSSVCAGPCRAGYIKLLHALETPESVHEI